MRVGLATAVVAAAAATASGFGCPAVLPRAATPPPTTTTTTTTRPATSLSSTATTTKTTSGGGGTLSDRELLEELERAAEGVASDYLDEECLVNPDTGGPVSEVCADEGAYARAKNRIKRLVRGTLGPLRGVAVGPDENDVDDVDDEDGYAVLEGELLERGWEERGNSSALRRNAEVWKFALKCVFKTLNARKLAKAGAEEAVVSAARTAAATFVRDGLLRLGPTFVKLGQVVSTRTDVLPGEFTDVLKTLQDDVPGFSGRRAKDIVSRELGKPCDSVFANFSMEPLAAASLGQVHTATYKGRKVAIKVQRAGLRDLFDVDLKNLKKLAELLDKFDPKTDGESRFPPENGAACICRMRVPISFACLTSPRATIYYAH